MYLQLDKIKFLEVCVNSLEINRDIIRRQTGYFNPIVEEKIRKARLNINKIKEDLGNLIEYSPINFNNALSHTLSAEKDMNLFYSTNQHLAETFIKTYLHDD